MLNISKAINILGLTAMLALTPGVAFAQSASPTSSPNPRQSARIAARLTVLHARCDNEITMRVNSLTTLNTNVGQLKKLSSSQISQFQSEIQTDITNLNTLKAKCDADTDVTTLISDIKSIFTNYRVYAVFMPQVRLLAAADRILTTADLLTDYQGKLAYRVSQQGSPSNLVALINDMQSKITDARTQANNVISMVTPLSPSSFPGSNPTLQSARTDVKTGATDLRNAYQDGLQVRQGLKSLGGTSITSSPLPTATP